MSLTNIDNCDATPQAWILQILLSEVLDVPTLIETGTPDLNINFYDPAGRFDYGVGYYMEGLDRAAQVIDCRLVKQVEGEPYKVCDRFCVYVCCIEMNRIKVN